MWRAMLPSPLDVDTAQGSPFLCLLLARCFCVDRDFQTALVRFTGSHFADWSFWLAVLRHQSFSTTYRGYAHRFYGEMYVEILRTTWRCGEDDESSDKRKSLARNHPSTWVLLDNLSLLIASTQKRKRRKGESSLSQYFTHPFHCTL